MKPLGALYPGKQPSEDKTGRKSPRPSCFLLLGLKAGRLRKKIAYQRFIWKCFSRLRYGRCLDRFEVASEGVPEGRVCIRTRMKEIQEGRGGLWEQIAPALGVQSR